MTLNEKNLSEQLRLSPVSFLSFDVIWSNLDNILDSDIHQQLEGILWCLSPRKRNELKLENEEWCVEVVTVAHEKLGGASDGIFRIGYCRKRGVNPIVVKEEDIRMGGDLIDVVDKRLSYGKRKRSCEEAKDGELNTIKGILSWKKRRKVVHVPTVYDNKNLVSRSLSKGEFYQVIDIPISLYCYLDNIRPEVVYKIPVPIRILHWALDKATKLFYNKSKNNVASDVKIKALPDRLPKL